jgi:hypothetical protein
MEQLASQPQHFASMTEDDWGTPLAIVQATHDFFGGPPDLDPASSAERNTVIGARQWLGLEHASAELGIPSFWGDARKIFINPPGGVRPDGISAKGKPTGPTLASLFWFWAIKHLLRVDGSELIWVANINQLQTLQQISNDGDDVWPYVSICVPSSRVKYLDKTHTPRSGTPSASAIVCVSSEPGAGSRFQHAFEPLGNVWLGRFGSGAI